MYQVDLSPDDNGALLAMCPELPEVTTFGANTKEALTNAVEDGYRRSDG